MSKIIINFWLDCLLLILFMVLSWASAVVQLVFPPGPLADGYTIWKWNYVEWRQFQFVVLCLFAAAVILHVMLHWAWICGVIAMKIGPKKKMPDDGFRTIYGVAALIVLLNLLGIGYAAALLSIRGPG